MRQRKRPHGLPSSATPKRSQQAQLYRVGSPHPSVSKCELCSVGLHGRRVIRPGIGGRTAIVCVPCAEARGALFLALPAQRSW